MDWKYACAVAIVCSLWLPVPVPVVIVTCRRVGGGETLVVLTAKGNLMPVPLAVGRRQKPSCACQALKQRPAGYFGVLSRIYALK